MKGLLTVPAVILLVGIMALGSFAGVPSAHRTLVAERASTSNASNTMRSTLTGAREAATPSIIAGGAQRNGPAVQQTTEDGADVSDYQGELDWSTAASDGIVFAWAKATQGDDYIDPDFDYDESNGNSAGIYMGAYDFACPTDYSAEDCTATSATAEADYFTSEAGPYFKSGYLYPALDLETGCSNEGDGTDSISALSSWVETWMSTVESYISTNDGYTIVPVLYTFSSFAASGECLDSSISQYPLWIADYGVSSPSTGIWSSYDFWQYADTNGPTGGDSDYFNGDTSSLQSGFVFGDAIPTSPSVTYAMKDLTTGASLSCGGSFLVGDKIQFTATVTGGTSPYTYAWTYGDGNSGTGNPATHAYSSTGTVDPMLTVTDANGKTGSTGSGCSFTVNPGLTVSTSLTASPNPVYVGSQTTLTVAASGGSSPYTYSYAGLPAGCSSSSTASLACTPTARGSYPITVTITDNDGRTATSSTTLTVKVTPLVVSAFTASPATLMVNSTTNLTVTASGGAPPYTYVYTGLPPGCSSSNTSTLACSPSAIGNYTVTATVTDTAGQTGSLTASIAVTPQPLVIESFSASAVNVTEGNSTIFTVLPFGGLPPYDYSYSGLPTGCESSDVRILTCVPLEYGVFDVSVIVSDSRGVNATMSTNLTVYAGVVVTSFTSDPSILELGTATTFDVGVAGGTSPYSFSYTNLPEGCQSSNVSTFSCTPTVAGTFHVVVEVMDADSRKTTSTVVLTVYTDLAIATFKASPAILTVQGLTTISVSVLGGDPPYSYLYSGLPSSCSAANAASITCTPTAAGFYNITVTVTDNLGKQTSSTVDLQVQAAYNGGNSTSKSLLGLIPSPQSDPLLYVLIGAIIAGVVAAAVVSRRKGKQKEPEDSFGTQPVQPQAEPETFPFDNMPPTGPEP